jgi:hypothetical protein
MHFPQELSPERLAQHLLAVRATPRVFALRGFASSGREWVMHQVAFDQIEMHNVSLAPWKLATTKRYGRLSADLQTLARKPMIQIKADR